MPEISEANFEATIERALLNGRLDADDAWGTGGRPARERAAWPTYRPAQHPYPSGYRKRSPDDYDRKLCLDAGLVVDFVQGTQPEVWKELRRQHGDDVRPRFLRRLVKEIEKRGTVDVLRQGIKESGQKIRLAYFRPSSTLNPEHRQKYEGNIFSVIRQLRYSESTADSLDMALFVNGLPLFTAELKNPLTGQTVENAESQYKRDRDPREPLFKLGRCAAHFSVDPELASFTTELKGQKTRFFPFNRGRERGAGNPSSKIKYPTAYLWEEIWAPDSVLDLVRNFIQVVKEEEEDARGHVRTKEKLIFPRYHQMDAVRRLVADAREKGPGQRYLIQHSAGSGKSNSIAWLAHQLSSLHDEEDHAVFDSVIIVTDRRVLDRQLQETVRQFEQTVGVVETIEEGGRHLKRALEKGKKIIVTTLQKFPVISESMAELPGQRFAVIVDEAHSSQSGENVRHLHATLRVNSLDDLEEAEQAEAGDAPEDYEDRIVEEMQKRGRQENVSTFAFTATPKEKTLELFGTRRDDGSYVPFSLYSMRQAIEEGFILDVLENYTTYKTYWQLLKTVEDDPEFERSKAVSLLRSYVDHHEQTIRKRVQIIVDHFDSHGRHAIRGKGKAMIVTRSRLHAVRYKLELDRVLAEEKRPYKALVAFSGTVSDGGMEYTETGMNGIPETRTKEAFKRPEYRFLVVANKFQTGFDQPLLHTMYLDKKLGGVGAVQTLSRLNRTHAEKTETMVLDFANEAEEIQKAFEPYYERTMLTEGTDPNELHDLESELLGFGFYDGSDVEAFARAYFAQKETQEELFAALDPVEKRFETAEEEKRDAFRSKLNRYVRLYAFLSQILRFNDPDLEKLYVFGRYLRRKLPVDRTALPVEVKRAIDLERLRVEHEASGSISLRREQGELEPRTGGDGATREEEKESLSQIVRALNERFGTEFTDEDTVRAIRNIEERLRERAHLANTVQRSAEDNAKMTFNEVLTDEMQELVESHFKLYESFTQNKSFGVAFLNMMFDRYRMDLEARG
jgi:type I restriction enzyme, R subunit